MTRAIIVVPPFISIAFGPLAGPSMLVAAARAANHDVEVVDLNQRWIRAHTDNPVSEPRHFIGDHDRPEWLSTLKVRFYDELVFDPRASTHAEIHAAAARIVGSRLGTWLEAELLRAVTATPNVVGVSVMYREQVEIALAITAIVRRLFPNVRVTWGGAHVTAMRDEIAGDAQYGVSIDGFVFGYAEQTWVDILNAVGSGSSLPSELVRAGGGQARFAREDLRIVPDFGPVDLFERSRLTLSLQASRGCGYGACSYCTYPQIEGRARRVPPSVLRAAIERAIASGGTISFKDSLVDLDMLLELAKWIDDRTFWSACTKLEASLPTHLATLARGGCHTLEIGLETLEPVGQRDARKRQRTSAFLALLDAAAEFGIALIVNYITGFPRSSPLEEEEVLQYVVRELRRRPRLVWKLEHNTLQVERLSRLARSPSAFGISVVGEYPWSSVLDWVRVPRPADEPLVTLRRRS